MKKITKKEKLVYTALISLIVAILLLSVTADVYAKYSSTLYGEGSIELARWEFKVNDKNEGQNYTIEIKSSIEDETKISPNSTGTFNITVENKSNVPAQYTISMKEKFLGTSQETDTLKIYTDNAFSNEVDIKNQNVVGKLESNSQKTITFYWKWVENTAIDQVIAENYSGFTVTANVVGDQTQILENENINFSIKNKNS